MPLAPRDPDRWQFVRSAAGLELCSPRSEGPMRLEVCAAPSRIAGRLRSSRRTDPLPRAVGLGRRKKEAPQVVDATAGLGRDALTLAWLGCRVVALERVPALAMFCALATADLGLGDRLEVVLADARRWLATAAPPTVVYLDPMFAAETRARVKKDMQICRALAGAPLDTEALLAGARQVARDRVVVKRHPRHAPLADDVSFTVEAERVRFDVYLAASPRA